MGRVRVRYPYQVLGEEPAVDRLVRLGERADEDGDELEALAVHHAKEEGQVHLKRVLALVGLACHVIEVPRLAQRVARLLVDGHGPERRAVLGARGQRAARQVHVVAGPEEEDAPDAAPIDVLVRPRGSQAGVRVAGVWRDDRTRSAARGLRLAQPAGQLFCQLAAVTRVPAARECRAPRRPHYSSVFMQWEEIQPPPVNRG